MVRARKSYLLAAILLMGGAALLLWYLGGEKPEPPRQVRKTAPAPQPEAKKPVAPPPVVAAVPEVDLVEHPKPLETPPVIVKGVYYTGWSAGIRKRVDYLVNLKKTTAVNTVVIDIKDYSGNVAYRTAAPLPRQYGAVLPMIRDVDGLIRRLHEEGIYVIARLTVFQDPILAAARPELAVLSKAKVGTGPANTKGTLWLDRKGLAWIDPASTEAWDYVVSIAKDAVAHGFDEVNFDYVRFPSDGDMKDMQFPSWDGKTAKSAVIRRFFAHLRKELPGVPISADLFGLATVNNDDLGIGQVIEDGYRDFDYVCPMVYPSHYARKFMGFPNPAEHPYEVVSYSMQHASDRLEELRNPEPNGKQVAGVDTKVKIRPWLQDFNLGAKYTKAMVSAQIQAVKDALGARYAGYLMWSSSNVYTSAALE